MQNKAILTAVMLTVGVTACGSSEPAQVVEQIVVRERGAPAPVAPVPAAGDTALDLVAMGQDAFQRCNGCHVVEAGAASTAGPNLHGVVGRAAGGLDGYPYTDALAAADMTWDEASLDLYLADPTGVVPGTDMLAGTVSDGESRAAIIAYLTSISGSE